MVNAVMDAIALLSSLASDLDTMLNDLRSAPSHATTATPTATTTTTMATAATTATTSAMPTINHHNQQRHQHQHQHQQQHLQQMQSRQLQSHHWQNLHNHNNNNNNNNNIINNKNNNLLPRPQYLYNENNKVKAAAAQIQNQTQMQQQQQQPRRRLPPKPLPRPPRRNRHGLHHNQQPARSSSIQNEDDNDTDASELANMTSPLSASATATRIMGLSPDVKKVQRLPLWCRHNAPSTAPANRLPVIGQSLHYQGMSEHTRGGTATATMTAPTTNILGHDDDDASKVEVIVYTKSDKTLKQNMNAKDETLRKRTSLIIVPQMETTTTTTAGSPSIVVSATSVTSMDSSTNENGNRNSIASMDSCVSHTTSQSNQSSTGSSNSSSSSSSDHHDDDAVYQDLQNGNAESERDDDAPNQQLLLHSPAASCTSSLESPSSSCASSSSSSSSCASSVDYSLREQLKNFANLNQNNDELKTGAGNDLPNAAQLLKDITTGPMIASDTLLSPQEVPLGRRYAEVSQFKGHHGKARASESSSLPTAPLVATPNTVETSTTLPVAVSCHNNNNNNNNNNINNNGQQSEKCPQQQQQQHSTNLNKANQKLNGPSNINNNNINSMTPANLNETTKKNAESLETDADAEDNVDSAHDADGAFEDDMQALLPQCARRSRDELSQSRTSLASEGGILAEGETSSEESSRDSSDNSPPCDLGLVERLLLTHPMWFLPGIQRSGAVHLLQGKEEGTFIVRGSSQPNTMAVSVRLPQDTGPYIEHYLIQSQDNVLSLESSRFKFGSIPALIAHYAQCCDELPVQLMLPRVLREANNRKKLSSLALLGQEFWSYASSPAVLGGGPPLIGGGAATTKGGATQIDQQLLLDAKSPLSLTETSGLGTATFFSEHPQQKEQKQQQPQQQQQQSAGGIANYYPTPSPSIFSPTGSGQLMGFFSQAGTPSDTTSSMSSFSTSGVGGAINSAGQHLQLLSPNSVDSVILTMSSPTMETLPSSNSNLMEAQPLANPNPNLSTFKTNGANGGEAGPEQILQRSQRPKPPNTLNLKPPAPPLRWSKPHSPDQMSSNFTVTTTVTFSMENNGGQANATPNANPPQFVEVTTPASSNPFNALLNGQSSTFQTFAKRLSPEGECKDTISSQGSSSTDSRWQSSQRKILSPLTPSGSTSNTNSKSRKSRARKESQHYQESDILESPQLQYCASALSDKISDYEDVWSHDPSDRATLLTSFKPSLETVGGVMNRRPDLLAETPGTLTPSEEQQMDGQQQLMQFSADAQPRSRAGLLLPISHHSNPQPTESSQDDGGDTTPTAAQTPGSRSKQGSPFYAEPADALRQAGLTNAAAAILRRQQRNQLLPATQRHSEPLKGGLAAAASGSPLLLPAELEKLAAGSLDELKQKPNQKPQANKRPRNRFENWQLDSSWEFMAKQQQETTSRPFDYETTKIANDWQQMEKENSLGRDRSESGKKRPLTVHQIILKHLPDLNLPELVRCSTPPTTGTGTATATQMPLQEKTLTGTGPIGLGLGMGMGLGLSDGGGSQKSFQSQSNGCRLSAYDNVERNCAAAFCQTYYGGIDSAQSDDGTVFSEPWDSTQWDSFMPQDDATINSDTIHLSKCRPALSEDDTIIEEYSSTKDGSQSGQDTLKANKNGGSQTINNNSNNNNNNNAKQSNNRPKVATIVRNPSMRDREVLCHPRNKMNIQSCGPGDSLRAYTLQLAQDPSSTFARQIENFICCTKESREAAPQVIMRNMRQFMSGMKNYLVKHGEGKFHSELETARARLKADEFLNLDAMLETVMHQLVVLPLREHLYGIFVDYYKRSEDIQLLAQNVRYACERDAADFGIRPTVTPPSVSALRLISNLLWRLQEAELPLDKLELFLCVISTVFDATGCPRGQQLGADDFLPVLVYVVAKCGFVGAEIEAEFMWGLLQPTLLNGEPGYYLTALCSAVQVLKTFMASEGESGSGSLDWRSSCLPACSSVLRVIIPDECNGSLQTRTLPVRPHTTTREVCRIIAHKARITNPQDYALFKLVDGEETLLTDAECPQDARLAAKGKHCMLAYKRIDAKIAWPTTATQTATQSAGGVGHSNGH